MPTTRVDSLTIYYDEQGAGHPLVLVAGLADTRLGWWKQTGPLSARYRVVNMDNRDAGDSSPGSGPYTIGDMADDVAGLIESLGPGPAYVAGSSMGGFIALELALRHPARVEKLVLIATSAGGPRHAGPQPGFAEQLWRREDEDVETNVRRTIPLLAAPGYMQRHPEDLDQIVQNVTVKPMSLEGYQRQLGAVGAYMAEGVHERLGTIRVPTLVVHGDADPMMPCANGEVLASRIPRARLALYPNVGHLVYVEAADRLNRDLIEFLG